LPHGSPASSVSSFFTGLKYQHLKLGSKNESHTVMKNILLLTATITPPKDAILLSRSNPEDRLNDYIGALRFYGSLPSGQFSNIVFVENSESDLSELQKIAKGSNIPVEFLSFNGLDYPPEWGRAYGEFHLFDYAIDHSNALKTLDAADIIWKVTGRYRAMNLSSIVRTAPRFDLYCDIRTQPMPWADLRVFGCTAHGYEKMLRGLCERVKENVIGTAPEIYLHPMIQAWAHANPSVVTRFTREPRIEGIRGKDSKNYLSGINLIKYFFRSAQRSVQRRYAQRSSRLF
jgi:hypothetical protein